MAAWVFVAAVLLGVVVVWRLGSSTKGRASKRLLLIGFAALVVITIINPEITTRAASWVGVGRGADLVFYLTAIGLMLLAALTYISHRRTENKIAEIVSAQAADRAVAAWEATDRSGPK
jgi:hypothetical protein